VSSEIKDAGAKKVMDFTIEARCLAYEF